MADNLEERKDVLINVGICSDSIIDRIELRRSCEEIRNDLKPEEFEIVEFSSVKEVMIYEGVINILLLDIGCSGLEEADWKEEIEARKNIETIVFVSDCIETIFGTFGKKTRGFLLKPIEEKKLIEVIKKCLFELMHSYEVSLESGEAFESDQIFFITSVKNYTWIHFRYKKVKIRRTLKEWDQELEQYDFVRVHKSYLVNMQKIERIKGKIELKNGEQIPIGRTYKKDVKRIYRQFLKNR